MPILVNLIILIMKKGKKLESLINDLYVIKLFSVYGGEASQHYQVITILGQKYGAWTNDVGTVFSSKKLDY